ncbi:MAG: DUF3194 domain-containing protein [Candidatus Bathyarchaeia archaeon]
MGTLQLSSLSYDQIEKICEIAEEAARKYVISKVPSRRISDLTISIDLEETETLNISVDVEVKLSALFKDVNVKEIARDSVKAAFEAVEKYLSEFKCKFKI